ncbi:PIG-L deacetylase family protein [Novosphingopyxis iocasae]|uniref:PIG-L deacetylase family protein n=1 Tax=Novosphingopyxis iocasae TaxID=2762729 RepID=UPI001651ACFC|nr:PIG-L family deacetylase [Novosphingopyxis iocasae]
MPVASITTGGTMLEAVSAAPAVELTELAPGAGVLLLSPHPDDETLGCGTAIAALAASGKKLSLVQITGGGGSHPGSKRFNAAAITAIRERELNDALHILAPGVDVPVLRLGLPDGRSSVDMIDLAAQQSVLKFAQDHVIGAVWSTWRGDPHCDHQTAAAAALRIAATLKVPHWSFPIWGRFGDRSVPHALRRFVAPKYRARKMAAIRCHRSQLGEVIDDDPEGFRLTPELVAHFSDDPEIFIRER